MRMKLLALAILFQGRLLAVELQPLLHVDLRGGMAAVGGQQSSALLQGQLFAVPALQFNEKMVLMPSLYFLGGGQERSLQETALFVRSASMGFKPQFRLRDDSGQAWTLAADLRHAYNIEAVNENYGSGHYDYEDYGASLGWDRKLQEVPLGLNVRYAHRGYPNYHNIASEQSPGRNFYIKDYYGALGEAHADLGPAGRVSLSFEQRSYPDSYVVDDSNGQLKDEKQQDSLEDLSLRGSRALDEAASLAIGWSAGWEGSQSNQNVFDSSQVQGLKNGNDYMSSSLGLSVQWRPAQTWSIQGGYSAQFRNFNRPIQLGDGSYQKGFVAEVEHDLDLGFKLPLPAGLAFVAAANAEFLLSNQQYTLAGIPSYNYYNANVGLQWDWKAGN